MACRAWILKPVLYVVMMMTLGTGFAVSAAELDDSSLFVEAFNAFQKKDYLLAIDKVNQLNQIFPDTPLRDVALLLLARSGLKAGDNELAAKTVNQFLAEFPANPLVSSIEEELNSLGSRHQKGEKLVPNKVLRTAAQKVRNDFLAAERAAAEKLERERQAKLQAERERLAREKAEAERREQERLAAEKAAKESIKLAVVFNNPGKPLEVGQSNALPCEIINRGKGTEEFLLEAVAPSEFGATLAASVKPEEPVSRVRLAPGETFKGILAYRMPSDRVDGFRRPIGIKAISAKYSDVTFGNETVVTAAAPLIRVVAKPLDPKPQPGQQVGFRVTVLNVGSLAAKGLTVRAILPSQFDFTDAGNAQFRMEGAGVIAFRIDTLESGHMTEYVMNLKVRENSRIGQELRSQIEIINGVLQRKDIFTASTATVRAK